MADFKFTDLTAGSTGIDNGSLFCLSEYDGVSAYTSKKYTVSTMRDIMNVWEAEDKITFDSTGTNKEFVTNGTAGILFDADVIDISADGSGLTQGWAEITSTEAVLAFGSDSANPNNGEFQVNSTNSIVRRNGTNYITVSDSGLAFHGSAAISKPTITGSKGGNAALGNLLTQLANYGLITDSTT